MKKAKNANDITALIKAIEENDPEAVKTILATGINVNAKDEDGETAIRK